MVRFGVLGTARVVRYGLLAPAKDVPGVDVTAVASRTQGRADEFAARHKIPHAFGSYDALVDDPQIDAVYIALPTGLHHHWAKRALEAGKHVLCEKPLAENARLAEDLAACAKKHDRVLSEGMHVRFLSKLRRHRDLASNGEFGRLRRVDSCFRTPYAPMGKSDFRRSFELGGGAALDVGCYAVSCLRYVAGEEPEILSVSHKLWSPQVERWMRADVRFPSGLEGSIEFGIRGFYTPRDGVVTTSEGGRIKWDGKGLVFDKQGQEARETLPEPSTYQLQLDAFAKRIRGEPSDALAPEDSVRTARVLDAMIAKAGLLPKGSDRGS